MPHPPNIPQRKAQSSLKVNSSQQPEVTMLFKQGFALHQQGQLAQAKAAYEQVLSKNPRHFDALHLSGVIALQSKNPCLAVRLIDRAIAINENNAVAYSNRGNALKELNRTEEAVASYDRAIGINPDFVEAHYNRGNALKQLRQLEESIASYDRAIGFRPDFAVAHCNRGIALQELKRVEEALESYDRAIEIKSDYAEAYSNRGSALQELNRVKEAIACYDRAIALNPDYAEAFSNRGVALQKLGRLEEAVASYDRAIAIKPEYAEAWYNRGNALKDLKRLEEAVANYDRAISIKCEYAEALCNRGVALHELGLAEEAVESYSRAIAIKPDYVEAYNNRGSALKELKRSEEAVASYDSAIATKPEYAEAWYNRGNALKELKKIEEAVASYDRAVEFKPDYAECFNNRGTALKELKRTKAAVASYERAIEIKPDYAIAWYNLGNVLKELKRLDESVASYARSIMINSDQEFLLGTLIHTRRLICDWSNIKKNNEQLKVKLEKKEKVSTPFAVLSIFDSSWLQKKAAQVWVETNFATENTLGPIHKASRKKKIRLGYYSADFHNHATSYLMADLFESHDRNRFELYAFSFGPDKKDEMRQRVSRVFDRFIDVRLETDKAVAALSRELCIDIAVDLKGFTQDQRTGIFSHRCAPIQVNYLGYPGTMGADYIDYLIADKTVIPPESQKYYSEKIVYLPHSYQVNDAKRKISDKLWCRDELRLPEKGFVFCCFNNNYKITPQTFDSWMRLLKAVEGSVLWLLEDNPTAANNLKQEAQARGVEASRLVFAKRMPLPDHLARHRAADLFIDTLPYNAHTTASDALWAGLPVLTQMGQSFAGRVAASLLNAIGLTELITQTQEEYEAKAIELASNPQRLSEIKDKLAANKLTHPLFNTALFTKHIQDAYTAMYNRYQADLAPDHIDVGNWFEENSQ